MGFAKVVVELAGEARKISELLGKSVEKRFKILEITGFDVACPWPEVPAHQRMTPVVQRHFKGCHHVEHHAVGVADMAARKGWFHTARG